MHVKHINAARHAKRCTFLSKMYTTENCIEQFSLSIIGESACGLPSFGLGVFIRQGGKEGNSVQECIVWWISCAFCTPQVKERNG